MSMKKRNLIIIISVVLIAAIALSVGIPLALKDRNPGGGSTETPTISLDGTKSIVSDALPENMAIYSAFPISSCYGLCNNYKFPVTAKITKPDNTIVTTGKEFVAETAGEYRVELSSQIGEEPVKKTVTVTVAGYDAGYLFDCSGATLTGNAVGVLPKDDEGNEIHNLKTDFTVGSTFRLLSSGSVVQYKNVVDLNSVSGNLIELVPNVGTDWFELTKLRVRLTDAYDASNSVSLVFSINPGATYSTSEALSKNSTLTCAFVQVEFNGVTAANVNYKDVANTTIAFGQQFFAQFYPEDIFRPLHFRYDNATNCIYLKIDLSSEEEFLVLDLDDPTDNYTDFKGFTTGEVYVSLESAGSAGSVTVTKIGNDTFAAVTEENYSRDTGCLLAGGYDFEAMPSGIVGYPYPLPKFANADGVTAKLEIAEEGGYRDITDLLSGDFVPAQAGNYRLSYRATNRYGYEKSVDGSFTVNENPTEITEKTPVDLSATLTKVFEIPEISYVGGIGDLSAVYRIEIDGTTAEVRPGQAVSFTEKGSVVRLLVTVTDVMHYSASFAYDIPLNDAVLKFELVDCFDKITLVSGSKFIVPDYIAIDYSKEDVSKNNVEVIIRRGKTRTVSVGEELEITSDTVLNYTVNGETVKTLSVRCVPQDGSDPGQALSRKFGSISGVESITTNDIGAGFTVNGSDVSVEMPYAVSTSNLNISFSVFAQSSFTSVNTVIRALSGEELSLELKNLGAHPVLWINGKETTYQVTTETAVYLQPDASGLYNKRYYKYSFVLDGAKGNLYNSEMVKIADIETWASKLQYDGFSKACAKVSFRVFGGRNGDLFVLDTVSNQRFTNIHIDSGEVMAPAIALEGELSSRVVKAGEIVSIPLAYCYDVLDDSATIRMSIYNPDGTAIVNNALPEAYDLTIRKYGTYSLVYTVTDSKYNTERVRYTFVVQDDIAPVITLNGTYGTYTRKGGVTVLGATVTDNNNDVSDIVIWLQYADLSSVVVTAGQHLTLAAGKYTIVYYAMDGDGNVAMQKYEFEVKEGRS